MSQIAPSAPQILVSPVVQLVNEDPTREFNMKYGPTQRLILAPGERLFVNEDVAWHFLGRWWSDNSNPRERARLGEYNRLRVLYGAYENDADFAASMAMSLKAYDPTGKPIVTVVDDPDGLLTPGGQTPMGREMSLESTVEVLRQQLMQMQAQIDQKNAAPVQEPVPNDQTIGAPAPFNPSTMPSPSPTVAGITVPVAPAPVGLPPNVGIPAPGNAMVDPDADELGVMGQAMPVRAAVAYDPSEQAAPEDAPPVVKQSATGGRVG